MNLSKGYLKLKEEAEKIKQSAKAFEFLSLKKEKQLPYAYPCDNYLETILSLKPAKKELKKLIDNYYKSQNISWSNIGIKVNATSFPKLQTIITYCSNILGIDVIPDVFISDRLKGINALALQIDDNSAILISPKSLFHLSDNELKFMLGHELSHLSQGNLLCHTANGILSNVKKKYEFIGSIVADLIEIPLKEWCRASEYTADRAGYLCCKDLPSVTSLFTKIGRDNSKTGYYSYTEIHKEHPYIQNRIDRIEEFARSVMMKIENDKIYD